MASVPPPSNLPLFYKDLIPLNSRDHSAWKSRQTDKAVWLAGQHAVPLTVEEFPQAQRHYPIVFSVGDQPVPLALMGLNEGVNVFFDEKGAIGRRYRRQDEAGTPFGITVDSQTLTDGTVTFRDRDSCRQWRVPSAGVVAAVRDLLAGMADEQPLLLRPVGVALGHCHRRIHCQPAGIRVLTGLVDLAQNIERSEGEHIDADLWIEQIAAFQRFADLPGKLRGGEAACGHIADQRHRQRAIGVHHELARQRRLAKHDDPHLVGHAKLVIIHAIWTTGRRLRCPGHFPGLCR